MIPAPRTNRLPPVLKQKHHANSGSGGPSSDATNAAVDRQTCQQEIVQYLDDEDNMLGVDLLVSLFGAAITSYRRSSVCNPFPGQYFRTADDNDYARAERAYKNIPSLLSIKNKPAALSEVPLDALLLLHHVIFQNPTSVVNVPRQTWEDARGEAARGLYLTCLESPGNVFKPVRLGEKAVELPVAVMQVSEPRRPRFEELAAEHGTITTFHGSSTENWQSIIHNGLQVLSGTEMMRTGDAFGEGIYFSCKPGVGLSYAQKGVGWERSSFGSDISLLAVCEVVRCPKRVMVTAIHGSGSSRPLGPTEDNVNGYILVNDPDCIRLKYVWLFSSRPSPSAQAVSGSQSVQAAASNSLYDHPLHNNRLLLAIRKFGAFKLIVVLYVVLLLGVKFLKR